MDERIKAHLKYLNHYYLLLIESRKLLYDDFIGSPVHRGSAERFLHLAIESCLNIGNRLIALAQMREPVSTPATYADIFKSLHQLGVVDEAFSMRLIKMAQFRNRLVHLYWELDPEAIYGFLQNDLEDFKLFQDKVVSYLNQNKI